MEGGKKWIVGILAVVCLIVCIALVVLGQRRLEFICCFQIDRCMI